MAWTIQGDPPRFRPWCGGALGTCRHEGRDRPYRDACERTPFRNLAPVCCATLVDGESVLLVERGRGANVGERALAGGHLEADEQPAVGAARKVAEETGFLRFESGHADLAINYAGDVADATGTLEAGDDAADARFWSREGLVADPPSLRASGLEQVLRAIESVGGCTVEWAR